MLPINQARLIGVYVVVSVAKFSFKRRGPFLFLNIFRLTRINAEVRRIGGGYGGKISNPIPIASACAVAVTKLNRPVRMVLDIENMIEMCSGRFPYMISYEVSPDKH